MARMESELYCSIDELKLGSVRMDDSVKRKYIEKASDEIDASLSAIYVTPLPYSTADSGQLRRTSLILNQICTELATGRAILGEAASSQGDRIHAYGKWLVERALKNIDKILSGELKLEGTGVVPVETNKVAGPLVSNMFESQVGAFYGGRNPHDPNRLAYGITPP